MAARNYNFIHKQYLLARVWTVARNFRVPCCKDLSELVLPVPGFFIAWISSHPEVVVWSPSTELKGGVIFDDSLQESNMDFSDSPPFWPSPLGPRVPDLDTKLRKTGNPNMDTALAWLRGELVSTFCFC